MVEGCGRDVDMAGHGRVRGLVVAIAGVRGGRCDQGVRSQDAKCVVGGVNVVVGFVSSCEGWEGWEVGEMGNRAGLHVSWSGHA